jgi:6-phospho-beta-glucosidase
MKITVLGAAGVRTPLIVKAMLRRQNQLGLKELALMDIDSDHLEIIGALTRPLESKADTQFKITRTTDARVALQGADFVISTFRVGGIHSRVIDERVPLEYGLLGQETTGAGGFAMGMRSIPVLLKYIEQMHELCPDAWLINFANPSGMLTEAAIQYGGWQRTVGICDGPVSIQKVAAAAIPAPQEEVHLGYFGLNHLGWVRSIVYRQKDYLPQFIEMINAAGGMPGLPFDPQLITWLGMIPNEYLFFYYSSCQAVHNILKAGHSRGENVAALNLDLFTNLRKLLDDENLEGMQTLYENFLSWRMQSQMVNETGTTLKLDQISPGLMESMESEGYAGVALDLIESLVGSSVREMILNITNQGSIEGMSEKDVVEIQTQVSENSIQPLKVGKIPDHCLGLMKQVKEFERLTIAAATQGSYTQALLALTIHPLVSDFIMAKTILDEYIQRHGVFFPKLH